MLGKVCEHGSLQRQCRICELEAEVTRLSGKTGFCAQCEAYAKEIEKLKKEVDGTLIPHSARCMEMEKALVAESEVRRLREALGALVDMVQQVEDTELACGHRYFVHVDDCVCGLCTARAALEGKK